MKEIDINNWKRREHFAFFSGMSYPQFNICFNIDITEFISAIKKENLPFYYTLIYLSTVSANRVEEFRYRIRGDKVVLHDSLTPSFTGMDDDSDLFKMVTVEMGSSLCDFTRAAADKSAKQKERFVVSDFAGRDDFIYYTSIPWISFTHISHTINLNRDDSVPRLAFGKYFKDGSRIMLPYSVQVNHSFVDGIHIGIFKERLEAGLNDIKSLQGVQVIPVE